MARGLHLSMARGVEHGAGHPKESRGHSRVATPRQRQRSRPLGARGRKLALAVAGGLLIGAGFAFFFDATQLGYAMGVSVKLFLRLLRG